MTGSAGASPRGWRQQDLNGMNYSEPGLNMRKSHLFANALIRSDAIRLFDAFWGPSRLTVLVYHRIADATAPDFPFYRSNVSASPEMFAHQMDYVAKHFSVIDLATLENFVEYRQPLPPRPLLITFDDGYLDNYLYAYPILRARGFPAVIFTITEQLSNPSIPWWDQCAYFFQRTAKTQAKVPLLGQVDLSTPANRNAVIESMLCALKRLPENLKHEKLAELQASVEVACPPDDHSLFISWDQARELVANGIVCQPHTLNHPILTRISYSEAVRQIQDSGAQIEMGTGQRARAFAYPNGWPGDYDSTTLQALRDAGYKLGFTLLPGPIQATEVRRHPLEIARVSIHYRDTFAIFVMRVMGVPISRPYGTFVQTSYASAPGLSVM